MEYIHTHTHTLAHLIAHLCHLRNTVKDYMVYMVNIPSVAGIMPTWQHTGDREASTERSETQCRLWNAAKNNSPITNLISATTKSQEHSKYLMAILYVISYYPICILSITKWQQSEKAHWHLTKLKSMDRYIIMVGNTLENVLAFSPFHLMKYLSWLESKHPCETLIWELRALKLNLTSGSCVVAFLYLTSVMTSICCLREHLSVNHLSLLGGMMWLLGGNPHYRTIAGYF